jgi:hypothetical protein
VRDRAVVSIRAARFGRNCSSAIAASTRSRVCVRMLGESHSFGDRRTCRAVVRESLPLAASGGAFEDDNSSSTQLPGFPFDGTG